MEIKSCVIISFGISSSWRSGPTFWHERGQPGKVRQGGPLQAAAVPRCLRCRGPGCAKRPACIPCHHHSCNYDKLLYVLFSAKQQQSKEVLRFVRGDGWRGFEGFFLFLMWHRLILHGHPTDSCVVCETHFTHLHCLTAAMPSFHPRQIQNQWLPPLQNRHTIW